MHRLEHGQKVIIMVAVMSAVFFAALNQTIVSTTLPRIVTYLGGMEHFTWVFTIYMLTSMIPMVIVGKLSDINGRRIFLLAGISIFIVGALLSGLATSIMQLITFRGLQGFGGGIIMSTSFATVGDLFPPRQRGNWLSMLTATYGLSSLIGPPLGGYIVDHMDWQWVFWVFIPVGILAFALIWALYPQSDKKDEKSIDYLGSVMLSATIILFMLAFSLGGQEYDWLGAESFTLFGAAVLFLLAFIVVEKQTLQPILPLDLFRNNVFAISTTINFFLGATVFGATIYIPLFLQGVLGTTATVSGYLMIPMTVCMVLGATISGRRMGLDGRYKTLCLVALAVTTLALYQLSTVTPSTSMHLVIAYVGFLGIGTGITFSIMSLTVQDAVAHEMLGVATGAGQLFRSLGGTIGVSVMGAIMGIRMTTATEATLSSSSVAQQFYSSMANHQQAIILSPQLLLNPEKLQAFEDGLSAVIKPSLSTWLELLRADFNTSLSAVFLGYAMAMLFAFLLAMLLKEIPLRTTFHIVGEDVEGSDHGRIL